MTVIDFFNVNIEKLINESFQETINSTGHYQLLTSENNEPVTADGLLIVPNTTTFHAEAYLIQLVQLQN